MNLTINGEVNHFEDGMNALDIAGKLPGDVQKTALAASGLGSASATAQMILKNSRLNALLDQELLNENMERAMYENNTSASLQAQQYRTQAQQYRRANRLRPSLWSQMGSALGGLFSYKGGY